MAGRQGAELTPLFQFGEHEVLHPLPIADAWIDAVNDAVVGKVSVRRLEEALGRTELVAVELECELRLLERIVSTRQTCFIISMDNFKVNFKNRQD